MLSSESQVERILADLYERKLSPADAKAALTSFVDLGFAKLDRDRAARTGFSEVIFGEGKSTGQVVEILGKLIESERRVLATRIGEETASVAVAAYPEISHNPVARTLYWRAPDEPAARYEGYVAVVSAGTADQPVSEEAAVTAEAFGSRVERVYDVGVAGIDRLFARLDTIRGASSIVVAAGMEGALGSVVAGLVRSPIVAVPTSVGYGANFKGLSALLTMLNSCAPGITVVNIDNGFGAGYYASLVASLAGAKK